LRTDSDEITSRMMRFDEICRGAGAKITSQRREIFRFVAQSDQHPDAKSVFRGVRRRVPTISLDTVYRTLWLFTDLGLITTLGQPRDRARFDANLRPHHHFVCRRCGLISDFHSDAFDELQPPEALAAIGFVESTRVEAKGVCRACSSLNRESRTSTHNDGRET
jgi:Fur family peroxide stress response transcriptional regulator